MEVLGTGHEDERQAFRRYGGCRGATKRGRRGLVGDEEEEA